MNNNVKKRLGKKIRSLRRMHGLTQESLGEKAGISYKFVGEIERGEVNPSLDSLIAIANALNISNIKDLFPGEMDIHTQFSPQELKLLKKALRLLNKAFSKA